MTCETTPTATSRWTALTGFAFLAAALWAAPNAANPAEPMTDSTDGPVYFVILQNVRDEVRFAAYVEAVMPEIARRGGLLVAGGAPAFMEGYLPHGRAVVFRYPSGAALVRFLASAEYADIRKLREGAVDWLAVIVPEVSATVVESY